MIPMGRLGKASEIAGMVKFLAVDPAGAYITGEQRSTTFVTLYFSYHCAVRFVYC
jgi:NAD(P)-dependent dehydrogenase (short-subunit alcohol dehydrogenase family)